MVDLLPRFYDCSEGEILIDGIPIRNLVIEDLRGLMGIVSQETILFNDTIFSNIAFGMVNVSEEDVIAAASVLRPVQEQQPNLVRHRRLCQRAQPARIPRTAQGRAIF